MLSMLLWHMVVVKCADEFVENLDNLKPSNLYFLKVKDFYHSQDVWWVEMLLNFDEFDDGIALAKASMNVADRAYGWAYRSGHRPPGDRPETVEYHRYERAAVFAITQLKTELDELEGRVAGLKLLKLNFKPTPSEEEALAALYDSAVNNGADLDNWLDFEIIRAHKNRKSGR